MDARRVRGSGDTGRRARSDGGRVRLAFRLALMTMVATACGERRDAADLAVGVVPFDQLRGINVAQLRSGGVRAFRSRAAPSPFEGLREPIGEYDMLYGVPGFDGSDGSWPSEDALVMSIEATREWPSDSAAAAAWAGSMRAISDGLAKEPTCAAITGPGFTVTVAEWDRGGGWSLSTSLARAVRVGPDSTLSARHRIGVRRVALTARYPREGEPNPDERPTWTRVSCAPGPADSTSANR